MEPAAIDIVLLDLLFKQNLKRYIIANIFIFKLFCNDFHINQLYLIFTQIFEINNLILRMVFLVLDFKLLVCNRRKEGEFLQQEANQTRTESVSSNISKN